MKPLAPLPLRTISLSAITLVAIAFCFLPDAVRASDERAKKLAALLKPAAQSSKGTDKDLEAAKNTTIRIIEQLQASTRTNGPSAESLIATAYRRRTDVGPMETIITRAALLDNWRTADALGLFDDNHHFKPIITRGPDQGKTALMEYIVPPSHLPEMSKHPANVRIVGPGEVRAKASDGVEVVLSDRENANREQFQRMMSESKARVESQKIEAGTKFGSAGLTAEQEREKFLGAMRRAGDAAKAPPNITLRARKGASPSHGTKYRWRVDTEVVNGSDHPTKIKLEYWMVGVTDEKGLYYLMKNGAVDLELLPGQTKQVELWTDAEGSYRNKVGALDGLPKKQWPKAKVSFRGYLLRAMHETGEVATFGTDQYLAGYLEADGEHKVGDLK